MIITITMIITFNQKINTFSENNWINLTYNEQKAYIQELILETDSYKNVACPFCNAKNSFVKYGTYTRSLNVLIKDELVKFNDLFVQRVICKSCNHTHALLPNFIIPYKQTTVFSITEIVQRAVKSSAYAISNTLNISTQFIYNLILLISSFYSSFKILNNKKQYENTQSLNEKYFILNCVSLSTFDKRADYFKMFFWILFMTKFRNNVSPPIKIMMADLPST